MSSGAPCSPSPDSQATAGHRRPDAPARGRAGADWPPGASRGLVPSSNAGGGAVRLQVRRPGPGRGRRRSKLDRSTQTGVALDWLGKVRRRLRPRQPDARQPSSSEARNGRLDPPVSGLIPRAPAGPTAQARQPPHARGAAPTRAGLPRLSEPRLFPSPEGPPSR